jgi:hypothetical protein
LPLRSPPSVGLPMASSSASVARMAGQRGARCDFSCSQDSRPSRAACHPQSAAALRPQWRCRRQLTRARLCSTSLWCGLPATPELRARASLHRRAGATQWHPPPRLLSPPRWPDTIQRHFPRRLSKVRRRLPPPSTVPRSASRPLGGFWWIEWQND